MRQVLAQEGDYWIECSEAEAKARRLDIIKCFCCRGPADRVDDLFPFSTKNNRCALHGKFKITGMSKYYHAYVILYDNQAIACRVTRKTNIDDDLIKNKTYPKVKHRHVGVKRNMFVTIEQALAWVNYFKQHPYKRDENFLIEVYDGKESI